MKQSQECRQTCAGCARGSEEIGVTSFDRRAFLTQGALAAALLALAACAIDTSTGLSLGTPPTSIGSSIKVSDYPALASTNGIALVNLNGALVAIVRTGETSFVALSRICPHQGGTINTAGSGFMCTRHGARFSLTGAWQGGQRTTNMRSYATTYDASTDTLSIA